jgi:hypothetical protein
VTAEHTATDAFRGADFRRSDLSGATFRDCDLTGARIVSSVVEQLRVSGFGGRSGTVVVDDVDVTAYVAAELDRRHPERVQLRAVRTADDHRAMWATIEPLWTAALGRAGRLRGPLRFEQVDGEWSFAETLRHLVFGVDVWIGRMVLGKPEPFSSRGLPPTDYPADRTPEMGIDLKARLTYADVVASYASRRMHVRRVLDELTDAQLDEVRVAVPAPAWGVESHSVRACLGVVLNEHVQHLRYAVRDLAVLETR